MGLHVFISTKNVTKMIPLCCLLKSIQNSSDSAEQTFKSLFEKEKPGRVHCYKKTMTPSQFRKNEEIAAIKKEHANTISGMAKEIQDLQAIVNFVVRQQNPDLDEEDLNNMMTHVLGKESSATGPYSSASTHDPQVKKVFNCTSIININVKYPKV